MIDELAFTLGPGIIGLPILVFVARRLRGVAAGEVQSEAGQSYRRSANPSSYWFYVDLYVAGAVLSFLMLIWSFAALGYLWEYRR